MSLLDLVEQHHGVGLAADLFRQLARFVITHIAGRRTDQLGNGVFLHILRHIQPDQRIHAVEQVVGKLLDQFRLAYTGGANEDKGNRTLLGGKAHTAAADGLGNRSHRFILTHDMGFQTVSQTLDLLVFLCLDLGGRNLRPQLNDPSQVLHGHLRLGQSLQPLDLRGNAQQLAADGGKALVMLIFRVVGEHFQLQLVIIPLLFQLGKLADLLATQVHIGASLVQKIDCLIRQEAVGDIPLGKDHALPGDLRGDRNSMVL